MVLPVAASAAASDETANTVSVPSRATRSAGVKPA